MSGGLIRAVQRTIPDGDNVAVRFDVMWIDHIDNQESSGSGRDLHVNFDANTWGDSYVLGPNTALNAVDLSVLADIFGLDGLPSRLHLRAEGGDVQVDALGLRPGPQARKMLQSRGGGRS